jgi:GNAT superfamily N-acetyltransferase
MQNAGLGRQVLEAAEQWAVEHWSPRSMHMTVLVQRPELIAWYERRGYTRTGQRKSFPYGDERFGLPRRDDLAFEVLRKRLPP